MEKELREDMAGTLMAISIVSKSLAKKLTKGEEANEQDKISTGCSKRPEESSR
jgi:hypothetical protein